ncbi:transcription-repair-coupling factor [Streptomyces badius]
MDAPEAYSAASTARALADTKGWLADGCRTVYVRRAGEALADYRAQMVSGGEEEPPLEVKIARPLDADVPHDYAPGNRLRLQAYRAIASASSEDDIRAVREELTDRYGPLPNR